MTFRHVRFASGDMQVPTRASTSLRDSELELYFRKLRPLFGPRMQGQLQGR